MNEITLACTLGPCLAHFQLLSAIDNNMKNSKKMEEAIGAVCRLCRWYSEINMAVVWPTTVCLRVN